VQGSLFDEPDGAPVRVQTAVSKTGRVSMWLEPALLPEPEPEPAKV
jgi:hypothetical protein